LSEWLIFLKIEGEVFIVAGGNGNQQIKMGLFAASPAELITESKGALHAHNL